MQLWPSDERTKPMATSDNVGDATVQDTKAATKHEAHHQQAEDRLEASAQDAETSFREHTAGAEAHLEQAEDRLAASAQKAEASFRDADTGPHQTIVAVHFADRGKAREGLERLRDLESQGQLAIEGLALVMRDEDGRIVESHLSGEPWAGRAGGGLVGVLIGILGGPLGMLLGGSAGVLVGAMVDAGEADQDESVLASFSKSLQVGQAALVAELVEPNPAMTDSAMAELGGRVLRRPLDEVEVEVAAAEKAQRKAEKEAREQLLKARLEMHKYEVHAKVEELKTKLHARKATAADS